MCYCILCHSLHTEELILSNIYESILSGLSVSIFSSSSVSLSDEIHILKYDELDTRNSYLLSIPDDYLIMDTFVILVQYNILSIPALLLSARQRTPIQGKRIFNITQILSQVLLSCIYNTSLERCYFSHVVLNSGEETVAKSSFLMLKSLCIPMK